MALAETVIGIFGKKEAGTAAFVTEAFTPPANSLLVARIYLMRNTGESEIGLPTISGGSLTYTARGGANTVLKKAWSTRATWLTAPVGGSPASMTLTIDDANNLNIFEYIVSVLAYTGYDTTTPIGGISGSSTTDVLDGEDSRSLSEAPRLEDITLLSIDVDSTKGPPKPSLETGWTSVHEKSVSGESGLAIAKRIESTSLTAKTKDVYVGGGTFGKGGVGAMVVRAGASNVTIVAPAASALASATSPVPILTPVAPAAQAVVDTIAPTPIVTPVAPAGSAIGSAAAPAPEVRSMVTVAGAQAAANVPAPLVTPVAPPGGAVASALPPGAEVRAVAPPGGAVGSAVSPVPEVRPLSTVAGAVAASTAPSPTIKAIPPAGAASASATPPAPEIRPAAPVAGAVASSTAPTPAMKAVPPPAGAVAGSGTHTPIIAILASAAAAVANSLAPVVTAIEALIPPYWQARARMLLGAAVAFFSGRTGAADIGKTPPAAATFATVKPQASFSSAASRAKFETPDPAATIEDVDPTAKIVT